VSDPNRQTDEVASTFAGEDQAHRLSLRARRAQSGLDTVGRGVNAGGNLKRRVLATKHVALIAALALFGGTTSTDVVFAQTSPGPDAVSLVAAALAAKERGDSDLAVSVMRSLAQEGDANAQYFLGTWHYFGEGVPQDYTAAVSWFRRAAERGNASSKTFLGVMYRDGKGVPQDYAAAVAWYRKAAEQGDALAQSDLGVMYGYGQGVPQDYVQAHKWFNLAAVSGDASAATNRGTVARKMNPAQIAEAQRLASAWRPTPSPVGR
jgi:TPR repeat protein